jgi:hypothetical protein
MNVVTPRSETRDGKVIEETGEKYFVPNCARRSFQWKIPGMDEEDKLSILQYHLHDDLISCPADCTFYENRRWATAKRGLSFVGRAMRGLPK